MKIYVTGRSGTGKSSIAKALVAEGITAVDIDNGLCHWENKDTGQYVDWEPGSSEEWHDAHGWVCDIQQLKKLISENENIVVVGAAENQDDYLDLFDKLFVLSSSPETIIARIHARTDNDFGKHVAEQRRILNGYGVFEAKMVKRGATQLDAERPLEEIVADIRSNFE